MAQLSEGPPGQSPGVKWQNAEFYRVTSQNRGMATLLYADRERWMERARKNARRQSRRRGKRILRHSPLERVRRNRKSANGLRPVKLARHRGDSVCTYQSGLANWQAKRDVTEGILVAQHSFLRSPFIAGADQTDRARRS